MSCPAESTFVEFVAGRLPAQAGERFESHIDDCPSCRKILAGLARAGTPPRTPDSIARSATVRLGAPPGPGEPPAAGTRLGRYVLLDPVGAGGMGTVYAARDPELGRVVAVKLLHRDVDARRLLDEAHAMARLAHPNVVAVHDVGTVRDQAFVVMELVAGPTLRRWLESRRRTWRAVLSMFVGAGRGLAAAHAAGLVHGDFKPDNVLVGADGRPRVTDFGLARPLERGRAPDEGGAAAIVVAGTPAYMAPEQWRGAADARSDQFSFCLSLWEALYGERPALPEREGAGPRPAARHLPARGRVPPTLRRLVRRGLDPAPAARFGSLDALLAAIDTVLRRRRTVALAAAALALVGAGAAGVAFTRTAPAPCRNAEAKLGGTWDAPRRARVRAAFLASSGPYADDAWRAAAAALDDYATGWSAMYRASCEATRVHGEQSEEMLELRTTCLDDRLGDARALVDLLAAADAAAIARATDAVAALPSVAMCADTTALAAKQPLPRDRAAQARLGALRGELARGRALDDLARLPEAHDVLARVAESAHREAYEPFEAEALLGLGRVEAELGDAKAAEATLYRALWAADRGRHDEARARAWTVLVFLVGAAQTRTDEGLRLVDHASAAIDRLVGADALRGQLLGNQGQVLTIAGRFDEAEVVLAQAAALLEETLGPAHPDTGRALAALSDVSRRQGRLDRALALAERALAVHERAYGAAHPETAKSLFGVGIALEDLGRLDEAAGRVSQALAALTAALGPDHIDLAVATDELGIIRRKQGRLDEALALHDRALELRERTLGPDHVETSISLGNRAIVLSLMGRGEEALADQQRALAITERALGPDHPETAGAHGYVADALLAMGRPREALAEFEVALAGIARTLGPEHADCSFYLSGIGQAHLALGEPAAAVAPLERALRLHAGGDRLADAEIRFALARALWATPRHRPRARQLAAEARVAYGGADEGRTVASWLATHRTHN